MCVEMLIPKTKPIIKTLSPYFPPSVNGPKAGRKQSLAHSFCYKFVQDVALSDIIGWRFQPLNILRKIGISVVNGFTIV